MDLNIEKVALDHGHYKEYLEVVEGGDGSSADPNVDSGAHDTTVKKMKCE